MAAQPLGVVGARADGDLRTTPGWPDLRAHPPRGRARLGRGPGLGTPRRLAYLWHLGTDRSRATEVDISFTGDAAATTVTIVHRGWERLGADAPAWRQRNLGGWSGLLPHYRQAVGT